MSHAFQSKKRSFVAELSGSILKGAVFSLEIVIPWWVFDEATSLHKQSDSGADADTTSHRRQDFELPTFQACAFGVYFAYNTD